MDHSGLSMRGNMRPRALRWYLAALCLGLTLPLLAFNGITTYYYATAEKSRLERDVRSLNENVLLALDREVAAEAAQLRALASSAAIWNGELDTFRREAAELARIQDGQSQFMLTTPKGEIIFDTRAPAAGAHQMAPPALQEQLADFGDLSHAAKVSKLVEGPTYAESAIFIAVEALTDRGERYLLLGRVPLPRLQRLIQEQGVGASHYASIVDEGGRILARSADSEKYAGRKIPGFDDLPDGTGTWNVVNPAGVKVVGLLNRSTLSPLSVTSGVAESALHAPLRTSLLLLLTFGLAMVALAGVLAWFATRAAADALRRVAHAASELGRGQVVAAPITAVREANTIGEAIAAASSSLHEQADALANSKHELEQRVALRTRELAEKSAQLETTLDQMDQGLLVIGADGRVIIYNRRLLELLSMPEPFLATHPLVTEILDFQRPRGEAERDDPSSAQPSQPQTDITMTTVHEHELANGTVLEVRTVPLADGGLVHTYTDVTMRKHAELHLRHLARHDPLTDLPNRTLLRERLGEAIAEATGDGQMRAVMCIDLDRFKAVNDEHGHQAGDAVLRRVAVRLSGLLLEGDTVGRSGGDEFILIHRVQSPEHCTAFALSIINEISLPYRIRGKTFTIGASIGIAFIPADGMTIDTLLEKADQALYAAKHDGGNHLRIFNAQVPAATHAAA